MSFRDNFSLSFRDMSITAKLGLGIGLLLSLMVMVAATGYLSMEIIRRAQESIRSSSEIKQMVLEMDRGMEKARRLHGDFYLQFPQIGLAKAHEQYAQPSVKQTARVIAVSNTLKDLIARSKVSEALHNSHVDLNLYLSSAKRFVDTSIQSVELVTELAAPQRGLHARIEEHLTALDAELSESESLAHFFREMKSFTQEYMITRKRFLMQSAFNAAFSLRKEINRATSFDDQKREKINLLIDQCTAVAEKILDVDVAIKSKFNDFALQAEAADKVSATLVKLAQDEVLQSQARISHANRAAIIIMASIALGGLIGAAGIAIVLNKHITRRVVGLTASAAEIRRGNLDVFAPEEGKDELSQLAGTFNLMTSRIKDLIDTLEHKVEHRTAELAESERRFRELFEHSSSGVAVFEAVEGGKDFIFKDLNKACEKIEQIERPKVIGRRVSELFPGIREFGLFDVFYTVWKTGHSARHPVSFYSDGRLEGWRENSVYKLPTGEIVAVYDDRTAQKQAETDKQVMEAKLQRAQKMEAVGLLAGGVAHDLNNILSGIIGYPDLLLLEISDDSELYAPILAIRESGLRAAAVVADLLTVARGVVSAKTTVNLNSLVVEYLESPEIQKLKSHHAHIVCLTKLDPQLHNVYCSPIHTKKCIMNLVLNAMEAIDGAGHIVLSTFNESVDERKAQRNGLQAGDYVVLRVADNGKGIPPQDLERIFEPFYTKKIMGRSGTGLGLAVVWNSMIDHDGAVSVESTGKGTSFDLYFPASTKEIVYEEDAESLNGLKGNGERILVVDDEPLQRDIAARMLKRLGYNAECAESGEKAVDYLRAESVGLVLLDMLMEPGMNGRETYERIVEIHPGQKAVIASGFSESLDVYQARKLGARGFIKKPYSIEELGRIIKEELSR